MHPTPSEGQSTSNEGPLLSYVSTFILNGNINVSLSAVKIVVENTSLHQILGLCNSNSSESLWVHENN